jgi:glyoxylase-like metal-dependent hydrolase (beta-lactamase superfamily II)
MALHSTITRFVTGDYLAPPASRFAGQRVVAVAYLVRHPEATLLFDTGFPFDEPTTVNEGTDETPIPTFPRPLGTLLAEDGTSLGQLDLVANCHLHMDHAGGNFRLPPELPIYAQQRELTTARDETDPLVTDALALDRQAYRAVDGEHQILPGLTLIPTPGHTDGHQSLVVETDAGVVILLGQGMPCATDFASAAYALGLEREGSDPVPPYPDWLPRMMEFEPARVMFAHDLAIWEGMR